MIIGRSYGGAIAVDLAQRYPKLVRALALLEPAILGLSAETRAWAEAVKAQVLSTAAAAGPAAGVDRFYRLVLGDAEWEAMPASLRRMYLDNAPAIFAELSGEPSLTHRDDLARLTPPVLIVSSESSAPAFRAVNEVLAHVIPGARHEVIGGGHLVSPAAPPVLAFPAADPGSAINQQVRRRALTRSAHLTVTQGYSGPGWGPAHSPLPGLVPNQ